MVSIKYLVLAAMASTLVMLGISTSAGTDLVASSDPRSDKGCEQVIRNEGEQNERTEFENVFHGHTMPDASRAGAQEAQQGAQTAVGDC